MTGSFVATFFLPLNEKRAQARSRKKNGVAWPCTSQGEKKRKAGEGVREKRTDQCQAGRFVSLVSSSATHEKSGAFGIYI